MISIYGHRRTRSDRVEWLLREMDVDYEFIKCNVLKGEGKTEEYLNKFPTGKIPLMVDGDFYLFESGAIVNYLAEKYPEKKMIPRSGTHERALYDQWMFFASTEIDLHLMHITQHSLLLPRDKRIPQLVERSRSFLQKNFEIVEQQIQNKKFMLGDKFQAIDAIYGHFGNWSKFVKAEPENCPNLMDYFERMRAMPSCPRNLPDRQYTLSEI